MGRIVYQQIDITIISDAAQDLWSVFAASSHKIKMHGWELNSAAVAAALMDINFHRISAVGSGGADPNTEEKANEQDGAILANVRTEDTTPGTASGPMMSYQWEQLGPVGHLWTPEMRPISLVSEGFALTCNTAIVATLSGWICWEEV